MPENRFATSPAPEEGAALWRGVALIVLVGAALGLAQNALMRRGENLVGLMDYQRRSLDWIRDDLGLAAIPDEAQAAIPGDLPAAAPDEPPPPPSEANGSAAVALPVIPPLPMPMEMQLAVVKAFVDQNAAAIVDARPREEFAEGHIPGAVNLPFDEAVTDPARLESFDAQGRPIIVYCGGGNCDTSKSLAFAMLQVGQKRLIVFMGGFPEWSAAGYPVATTTAAGRQS